MLTAPPLTEARQPRGVVLVAGTSVAFESWEVDSNSNFQADTFRLALPVSSLPSALPLSWWSSASDIDIEIYAGFPRASAFTKTDLERVFSGRADNVEIALQDGLITVDGRDRTADLIDAKTSEKYVNLTASQIVEKLAASHGLKAVVTPTDQKAGVFYSQDHVRQQDDRTEWDLVTWLAREVGFAAYVVGDELHFEPKPAPDAEGFAFKFAEGRVRGSRPVFRRSLTLAKDIKVIVRSWNAKSKGKPFERSAQLSRTRNSVTRKSSASQQKTPTQQYVYSIPGLQPDEAQKRADAIAHQISLHEIKFSIEGPADTGLSMAGTITVSGTGTGLDQTYYPDSVVRSMDANGYGWRVEAKNHATDSEVSL